MSIQAFRNRGWARLVAVLALAALVGAVPLRAAATGMRSARLRKNHQGVPASAAATLTTTVLMSSSWGIPCEKARTAW
jgi:hypothetical protein